MPGRNPRVPVVTDKERVRRLLALPDARPERIERLREARVAIVGMGGLGNTSALYLAAQGVGHLTLIDGDTVDAANLGRQVLFGPNDIGDRKVDAAVRALVRIAPEIEIHARGEYLTPGRGAQLLDSHDIVLDGLDTTAPREWLNRWAVTEARNVLFAGAVGYEAQVFGVRGGSPCLACLWPSLEAVDRDCATYGILGPLVGLAGSLQAAEAIKWLLGLGVRSSGTLWTFDMFQNRARILQVPPNPSCPVCHSCVLQEGC